MILKFLLNIYKSRTIKKIKLGYFSYLTSLNKKIFNGVKIVLEIKEI